MDLHDAMMRALWVFAPEPAMRWFTGHESFFDGARPIDVLTIRGVTPIIDALDMIAAGGFR